MSLISYKFIAALIIFIVSLIAAYYPIKRQQLQRHLESRQLGEALASGIFLGAAFFHMLPDAIHIFKQLYGTLNYPVPEAICVMGFLFLLFLERLSLSRVFYRPNTIPYLLAIILMVHALIEGAALGIGHTFSEAGMIFIAVIAHKGSESFALSIAMIRHTLSLRKILGIVFLFACMTPIGIGLGALINAYSFAPSGALIAGIFDAFAAGTFLYISTLHHVHFHQHQEDKQGLVEFSFLVLGVALMGIIAIWT